MANIEDKFNFVLLPFMDTSRGYHPSKGPGQPNLPIKRPQMTGAADWMARVRRDIDTIANTKVGFALLCEFTKLKGKVTIEPMPAGHCNAGVAMGRHPDDLNHLEFHTFQAPTLAGVAYNPLNNFLLSTCSEKTLNAGGFLVDSHETLLHELVHALRHALGLITPTSKRALGKGLSLYTNTEEFNAVLLQGIYASERKTPIRASHNGKFEIDKEFSSSLGFFKSSTLTYSMVEKLCHEHPTMTKRIANVAAQFNPILAYYYGSPAAKRMARSAKAKERDVVMPIKNLELLIQRLTAPAIQRNKASSP